MDRTLLFLINRDWARPWLDTPMAVFSSWDFWWPFFLVGGIAIVLAGGFRARAMVLAAVLAVGVSDGLIARKLKKSVGRPRPHEVVAGIRTIDLANAKPRFLALGKPLKQKFSKADHPPPRGNSFPSSHAANNFAVATMVAFFYRRWGWLAFVPAVLTAYSRIYTGSHWPSDVAVACLLGIAVAAIVLAAMELIWRRWGGCWLPRLHAGHPSLREP